MLWIFQICAGGHLEIAILRVITHAFVNGTKLDRFSVKFTPRNKSKTAGPPTVHTNFSGLLQ